MTKIPSQSKSKYKLGAVSYLNARPLVAGLESDPRIECVRSLQISKSGPRKVEVRLGVEVWVVPAGRGEA